MSLKYEIFYLKEKYMKKNKYYVYEKSIERCQEEKLFQTAYFIQRELTFLKEVFQICFFLNVWQNFTNFCLIFKHKDNLIKQYEKIKTPINNYAFKRNIWFPKNYIIEKHEYEKRVT